MISELFLQGNFYVSNSKKSKLGELDSNFKKTLLEFFPLAKEGLVLIQSQDFSELEEDILECSCPRDRSLGTRVRQP